MRVVQCSEGNAVCGGGKVCREGGRRCKAVHVQCAVRREAAQSQGVRGDSPGVIHLPSRPASCRLPAQMSKSKDGAKAKPSLQATLPLAKGCHKYHNTKQCCHNTSLLHYHTTKVNIQSHEPDPSPPSFLLSACLPTASVPPLLQISSPKYT